MIYKVICLICSLSLISFATKANNIELCGSKAQGEILTGHAANAKKITLNNKDYMINSSGDFMIAFGRDDQASQKLFITDKNGKKSEYKLSITPTQWDVQNIKGVPQKKVTPSKADQAEINRERQNVKQSLTEQLEKNYWKKGFIKPVEGRISGNFGGQRIMNGNKMNPHQGMDIAAAESTPVKASSGGIIRLSGGNYFYSGNMVVIDHGHNLFTIYAHLKNTHVKVGDYVKQGQIIGEVGKTGRATGPHLHWGASLNDVRFDPASLLHMNNNNFCFNL